MFKCVICGALFFDLKDLKHHFFKSQQIELDRLNLENSNKSSSLNRRIIFKQLKQKYVNAFNKKTFKWINDQEPNLKEFVDLLNKFSFKKLQFSTRCSTIASINLINSNFQFFRPKRRIPKRIQSSELVCPECGLSFSSRTQSEKFRLHLLYECMFTMKYDCGQIKCPSCSVINDSVNEFVQHWSKTHVKIKHECKLCDEMGERFIFNEETNSVTNTRSSPNSDIGLINKNKVFKNILDDEGLINGNLFTIMYL